MYIRKARAGSVPGYTWTKEGEVLELPDHLAEDLLLIPNGGFSIAEAPKEEEEPEEVVEDESGVPARFAMLKTPGRPRLPRDEHGNIIRN